MKNNSILIKYLLSDFRINIYFQNISLMLIGTLILAFSSKVQVPFWPVPMTMQTFAVFIIGMTFGSKLAFFTLVLYLFEGAIGLPVFCKRRWITLFNRSYRWLSLWNDDRSWCCWLFSRKKF